jgi:hypothetical protein
MRVWHTGRNQFRGPGYLSDNLSLFKNFAIYKERVNLETRFDAFNATNTPAFGLPGGTLGSGTSRFHLSQPAISNSHNLHSKRKSAICSWRVNDAPAFKAMRNRRCTCWNIRGTIQCRIWTRR